MYKATPIVECKKQVQGRKTAIQIRDVVTGKVTLYPSATCCYAIVKLTKDQLRRRCEIGDTRVWPELKQYRYFTGERPWYIPGDIELELLNNGLKKAIDVKWLDTGEVRRFDSNKGVAKHFDNPPGVISRWLNDEGQPVLPGFVQMKYATDTTPWRDVEDPYIEIDNRNHQRPVKVTRVENDENVVTRVFVSLTDCARTMGLTMNTLYDRLQSNGEVVFPDSCVYSYYCP